MAGNNFLKNFVIAASMLSLTLIPAYTQAYGAETTPAAVQNSYMTKEQFTEYNLWTNYINDYPNDAFGYFNRANIQYSAQDYKRAIADYDKAINLDGNNADIFLKRGNCHFVLKENSQALLDYTSAARINPKMGEAYFNIGRVYYEQNDFEKAAAFMRKGVAYTDDRQDYFYELGRAEYKTGKFDEAYNDFTAALSFDPNNTDALFARGLTAMNMKNYDTAIQNFNKVAELNPSYPNLQSFRGMALYQAGDFKNAIPVLNDAITENPKDGMLYNIRGNAKELTGDKSGAKKDYKTAKSLGANLNELTTNAKKAVVEPVTAAAKTADSVVLTTEEPNASKIVDTGFVFVDRPITPKERKILDEAIRDRLIHEKLAAGDIYGALALLEKRAEAEPKNPENYLKLAKTKVDLNTYKGVISDAETAIMNGSRDPEAYYLEGLAYSKNGNNVYAYRNFAMCYSADNKNPDYIYHLAEAAFNIGRYHEAYDLATTLLDTETEKNKYPEARLLVAKTEYKLGKYFSAVDDCNKYAKNNKKSSEAYLYSAFSKEALEKYNEAIKDYKKAIKRDRSNPELHKYRGDLNLAMGHKFKALHDYEKIVRIKGKNANSYDRLRVAKLKEFTGSYADAIACYSKFIKDDSLNDEAYKARAHAYAKKGDVYNAIADYSTTLRLNPYQTSVYKERGILLVQIRSYRRGIEDLNKAIAIEPKNGQLYYYRGLANKALGRADAATADYAKAKEFEAL